ncbi:MAG: phosphatase PAP2 family protein [Thermoanaerobaculaceae bacterium]|jgi:hypothetical protein|nr:phosphatase PAP2 family protein [Thermoanaerobaculaceae bacterium]
MPGRSPVAALVALLATVGAAGAARAQGAAPSPPAAPAAASQPAASPSSAAGPPAASGPTPCARPAPAPAARPELRVSWKVDLPVTLVLGATWLTVDGLEARLGPSRCRWCEPDLNGLDAAGRGARWGGHAGTAATLSNVTAYGLAPAASLGLVGWEAWRRGGWRQAAADDLLIFESAVASAVLVQGLKYSTARTRPFVRDLPDGTPPSGDHNLSFPSGHTAFAFSLATAAGTVATLRGYRVAPYVWGFGMAVAAFTGYLRLAADEHYASDVLVGAVVGSLVGWAVPYLLHRRWRRP